MSQRTKHTLLIRLLVCLLVLGTQPWFVGLHAADQPVTVLEFGGLPSEAEDQNEGPDGDPVHGIDALQDWSLRSASGSGALVNPYEPDFGRSGLSLLPVAGLQPSAP